MSYDFSWRRWNLPIPPPAYSAAVSSRGSVCFGGSDYRRRVQDVTVFDAPPGETRRCMEAPGDWSFVDHQGGRWSSTADSHPVFPRKIAWSPDGEHLITAAANPERVLRLFDAKNGYLDCFGDHEGDIHDVVWSPQGRFVASSSTWSRHQLKLWRRMSDGVDVRIIPVAEVDHTHDYLPWWKHQWMSNDFYGFGKLSFSPDERWLAVEIQLRNGRHRVAVYAVPGLDDCFTFPLPAGASVADITWDPYVRCVWVATSSHGMFFLGPLNDDVPAFAHRLPGHATRCEVSPCGRFGAVVYRTPDQGDTDASATVHEIQVVELPEFRTVARLHGVGEVNRAEFIGERLV